MPSSPNAPDACLVRRGATQFFDAFVTRIDGFNEDITLTAEGLPQGVTCRAAENPRRAEARGAAC